MPAIYPHISAFVQIFKRKGSFNSYLRTNATDAWYEAIELSALQRRTLQLLGIPDSVYTLPTVIIPSG